MTRKVVFLVGFFLEPEYHVIYLPEDEVEHNYKKPNNKLVTHHAKSKHVTAKKNARTSLPNRFKKTQVGNP